MAKEKIQYTYKVVTKVTNILIEEHIYQSDMTPYMMFLTIDNKDNQFIPFENYSVNIKRDSILSVTHIVK